MAKYIMKRFGAMLLTLFLVMALSFWVVRLMPKSIFENPEVSLDVQKKLEAQMGLDKPMIVQFYRYMRNIITQGDFGTSVKIRPGLPVWTVLVSRLPPTIIINIFSLFISIPLGILFGILAALRRNTWIDNVVSFFVIIFISVPSFVFGAVMQYGLTFAWPIFPTVYESTAVTFAAKMHSLTLPIVALSLNPIATITRYVRGELIENLNSEYLLLARTKGLTKVQSIWRHAFRNSLIPIANTLISMITGIMGGSLVIEKIFAVPGEGGLLVESIFAGDHFLTVALLIFYSATSLITILIVDIAYGIIDPRIRVGGGKQ